MRRCLPGTWTLAGTVVSAGGEPVAGAEIRYHLLVDPTDPRRRYARRRCASGANGEFLLYDLTSRLPVHVLIRPPRHGYWRGDSRGRDDQYKTRRIMLQRGADIVGEVVGPDGRPATKTHMRARFSAPVSPGPRQPEWLTDSVRTDRRARFVLRNVPPGEVELRIARDGWVDYESEALDIESSDGPVRHAIRIPASGKIVGRVIGPEGVPLPEGRIVAQRVADGGTRGAPLWIILDEDGFFESDWREPGRYRLTTVVPGFWPTVEHVESGPGPTPTETELRIGSGQTVTGTVLDVDGTPLREAAIGIYEYAADRVDGWRDWHSGTLPWRFPLARTDRLGRFTIRGVDVQRIALITGEGDELRLDVVKPAGPAGVPVQALMTAYKRHDGTYSATGGVLIQMPDEGDPAPVEIRVERPYETESLCRVTGTIHDEAGRFPEDTRLVVGVSPKITGPGSGIFSDQPPSRTQHYYVTTDPGGRYEIVSIPSGTYFLIAGSESKHFQLDEVVLAEGSSVDLGRRRLPIAGAMEGGVRGADGQPIAGGVVVAARYAENVRNARPEGTERDLIRAPIDQDGRYRFDSLDPGYWFVASVGAAHRVSAIRRAFVDGAAEIIDIRHAYTGGLQGRLVDMRTGDRLPDGTVSLRSDDARGEFSAGANADGRFALEGLPAGSYTVRPYHRECLDRPETKVEVADGETTEVTIQLRRGALTRGRIV
ncbi:MAG TPA: carboxypeptidase regulatory-like domain-containing protein, partial [Armatimonadota bacterium]|nr:carboxypeptidase regulatory-like domain-containing protein [Armatimonadota bacterium]